MLRSTGASGRARTTFLVVAAAVVTLAATPDAWARMGGGGGHFGGHVAGGFSGGSIPGGRAGFAARGGGHGHGHFRGAVVIGGLGFWYPAVYPYPYGYAYPYYAYPYPYGSAAVPAYNMPPPAQVWYYCDAAGAYYPNVTSCPGGWREVPATPPQTAPVPVQ